MEKKIYEEPSVTKVEFDFNERIAASLSGQVIITGEDPCIGGGDGEGFDDGDEP